MRRQEKMPMRHIRDRKPKILEETPKVVRASDSGLAQNIQRGLNGIEANIAPALNILGLPKDIPGLAGVTTESLNSTIGLLERSGGMLNMSNPAMQGIGAIGLAYALKPELVKGFLGSPIGSGIVGGLGSFMVGQTVGGMVDSPMLATGIGAAMGYAFGAALAVPGIGLLFGGLGSFIGAGKRKRAKRRARRQLEEAYYRLRDAREQARGAQEQLAAQRDVQRSAFENFLEHADLATQSLLQGKQFIDAQRERLQEQRDINMGIVAANENEIRRVAGLKNESIRRETERVLGRQRVQMAMSGTSFAGSFWYIEGDTIDMGLKSQQEVRLSMESELKKEAIKYRELMNDYKDMSTQLDYAYNNVEKEVLGLKSDIRLRGHQFEHNLRILDLESKSLGIQIDDLTRRMGEVGRQHSKAGGAMLSRMNRYDPFRNDFSWKRSDIAKEHKLLEEAEKRAGALTAMSFGEAVKSTKAGVNPFDALFNYGLFA